MEMNSREIKQMVDEKIKGNWIILIGYMALSAVLSLVASAVFTSIGESLTFLASLLITAPLSIGVMNIYMKVSRRQEAVLDDFLFGFKHYLKSVIFGIIIGMVIGIPAIVIGLMSALSFLTMNAGIVIFVYIVFAVIMVCIGLLIAFTLPVFIDNVDGDIFKTVSKSISLGKTNFKRLLKLCMTFVPWYIPEVIAAICLVSVVGSSLPYMLSEPKSMIYSFSSPIVILLILFLMVYGLFLALYIQVKLQMSIVELYNNVTDQIAAEIAPENQDIIDESK